MDGMPTRWIPDSEADFELGNDKAYHAWTHFRDLAPYKRTMRAAHREHMEECEGEGPDETAGYGSYVHWAREYKWKERVREIDEEVASYKLGERIAAQQRIDAQELELGDAAINLAIQRIEEMEPQEISPAMADRWVKAFSDLRRRAVMTEENDWNAEKNTVELRMNAKDALLEKLTMMAGRKQTGDPELSGNDD